jgi:hypothetical protein
MGNRARRGANAVSLFPFLAVLICAMGALILLLLVTTRRIRQQQLQTAAAVTAKEERVCADASPAAAPPLEEPHGKDRSEAVLPLPPEPDPRDVPLEPLFAVDPPPPLPDPNDAWRERLKALTAEHSRLVAAVAEHESTAAETRTTIDARRQSAGDLEKQQADADQQIRDIKRTRQKLQQEESDSHREAALLRRQIDEAHERLADASSKFTIMPFDGRGGTTRRPIIIECTDRAISFVSEGVTLGPDDLEGFNARYNPLLYATVALADYWERTERHQAVEDGSLDHDVKPYVLLVVRPQGTITYYRAREFLARMEGSFGYELVCADQEFVWPESDATAAELCRSVIERMLSERESLMATIPGALSDQIGRMSDEAGRFRLEEVDEVRNLSRRRTFNGQSYHREPVTTRGTESSDLTRNVTPQKWGAGRGVEGANASGDATFEPETRSRVTTRGDKNENASGLTPHGGALGQVGRVRSAADGPGSIGPDLPGGQTRQPSTGGWMRSPNQSVAPLTGATEGTAEGSGFPLPEGTSFTQFAQNSRMTSPGASDSEDAPVPLDITLRGRSRTADARVDGQAPWSLRARAGAIGFEREVLVRVTAAQVSIADETAFMITEGLSPDELRRRFLLHLEHHIETWDSPPRSFYWLPSIKFVVSPGGNQYHQRLKTVAEEWELQTTVEHVLE